MLSNSLFLDFLKENGLKTDKKEKKTRDLIGIEFNYGSSSYSEAVAKLKKKMGGAENKEVYEARIASLAEIKDKFDKKSRDELRTLYYENGVTIHYYNEDIHYRMLYRTPGKAKKGSCMFIRDSLYQKARDFLYMGLKLPEKNAPIVEIGAYSSLITSTIEGRVEIPPENILILQDVDSFFNTRVASIETDDLKRCYVKEYESYTLKNTMFDGQALIDESIFPEWGDGYILLRQHFTKCAAFCTKIQKFMREYFLDEYDTAQVTDMFGVKHYVKDIMMITTDNAMKWLKFQKEISEAGGKSPYEYWSDKVRANGSFWGIVKTAHQSKLGSVQRMSYQMVNALSMETMEEVMKPTQDYLQKLKEDEQEFISYLKRNDNFSNDYGVLAALCEYEPEFVRCKYYRDRKKSILITYMRDIRGGRLIQNADNLVVCGSPYAMLLHAVGEDPLEDPTFQNEDGAIQCWTSRFKDGEYLAEFRNPFNGKSNLGYFHNHYDEYFDRYFKLGDLVIAVNMNGTDCQDRNNGSDQDSDSFYVTNQKEIVEHAKYCYENYPTIVNNIPKEKNIYTSSLKDFATVDNQLAHSQLNIGESSNLAQIALSYSYIFKEKKFNDAVCILSVLAQAAIDSSKRRFDINIEDEIKRIKQDINVKENKYPEFWLGIRRGFDEKNINYDIECPMNILFHMKQQYTSYPTPSIPIQSFLMKYPAEQNQRIAKKIANMISQYSIDLFEARKQSDFDSLDNTDYFVLREDFDDIVEYIRGIRIGHRYISLISWLIDNTLGRSENRVALDHDTYVRLNKNRSIFTKVLYEANPQAFLLCFSRFMNTPSSKKA